MKSYFALLDGETGGYGIAFPDCPGCTAMGATQSQTYDNAIAALGEWMHDARIEGPAPEPRGMEDLRSDAEGIEALAEGAALISVPLIIEAGRPVKASISLDQSFLDAIDAAG